MGKDLHIFPVRQLVAISNWNANSRTVKSAHQKRYALFRPLSPTSELLRRPDAVFPASHLKNNVVFVFVLPMRPVESPRACHTNIRRPSMVENNSMKLCYSAVCALNDLRLITRESPHSAGLVVTPSPWRDMDRIVAYWLNIFKLNGRIAPPQTTGKWASECCAALCCQWVVDFLSCVSSTASCEERVKDVLCVLLSRQITIAQFNLNNSIMTGGGKGCSHCL